MSRNLPCQPASCFTHVKEGGFCDGLLVTRDNETAAAADRMAQASILGNDKKIRAWKGQLSSVPAYQVLHRNIIFGSDAAE